MFLTVVRSPGVGCYRHALLGADLEWTGRPWLDNGSGPFDLNRALGLGASSPGEVAPLAAAPL